MTRISCNSTSYKAEWMLHTLIPCLSSLIAPAAGLCIDLDRGKLLMRAPSPDSCVTLKPRKKAVIFLALQSFMLRSFFCPHL